MLGVPLPGSESARLPWSSLNTLRSVSSPAIRGGLVGLFEICLQLGTVVGFWINCGVNQHISSESRAQWMIPVGVQFAPAGAMIISMLFVVASPRWLIKKDRLAQATKDLIWLRQLPADHQYIVHEIGDICWIAGRRHACLGGSIQNHKNKDSLYGRKSLESGRIRQIVYKYRASPIVRSIHFIILMHYSQSSTPQVDNIQQ
jgi:Sugar (and other) transporter